MVLNSKSFLSMIVLGSLIASHGPAWAMTRDDKGSPGKRKGEESEASAKRSRSEETEPVPTISQAELDALIDQANTGDTETQEKVINFFETDLCFLAFNNIQKISSWKVFTESKDPIRTLLVLYFGNDVERMHIYNNISDATTAAIKNLADKGHNKARTGYARLALGKLSPFTPGVLPKEATEHLKNAAGAGDVLAMYLTGVAYGRYAVEGVPKEESLKTAITYCQKAVVKNYTGYEQTLGIIYYTLGNLYRNGKAEGGISMKKALKCYHLAATQDDIQATEALGDMYYQGGRDYEKALEYYSMAAEKDRPDAVQALGGMYWQGLAPGGKSKENDKKARQLYEGLKCGFNREGLSIRDGMRTKKEWIDKRWIVDTTESIEDLQKAAEAGGIEANRSLGLKYYFREMPGTYDCAKGYDYLQKASEGGDLLACRALGNMFKKAYTTCLQDINLLSDDPSESLKDEAAKHFKRAKKYLLKAFNEKECADSAAKLAEMYHDRYATTHAEEDANNAFSYVMDAYKIVSRKLDCKEKEKDESGL